MDGTKLEADAGKFTYVWAKNVERARSRVTERVREILRQADALNEEEDRELGTADLPECGVDGAAPTAEEIRAAARRVAEKAEAAETNGEKGKQQELEKKSRELAKEADKQEVVEERTRILGGRNSFSKTDKGATFMRMKNKELRAGYNLQIGTEQGFVLAYTVSQNANDASAFVDHMDKRNAHLPAPVRVAADAAYGSEENQSYLEGSGIESHLKDQAWAADRAGKHPPYDKRSFAYDQERDSYTCPQGHEVVKTGEAIRRTARGFQTTVHHYETTACSSCPVHALCAKNGNKKLQRSPRLEELVAKARANIDSEKGLELRKRRGNEVESVFGDMKHNQRYTRVRLRGLAKAVVELGYVLLGQNLRKLHLLEGLAGQPQRA